MIKNLKWKAALVVLITGVSIWMVYPPFDVKDKDGKLITKGKVNLGLDLQGGMHILLRVDTSKLPLKEAKDATDRALEIIRNRIDQFGVLEPTINKQGTDNIVIQLPGVTDRERAVNLVKSSAHLEFKIVSDDAELFKKALNNETVEGYELKEMKSREGGKESILLKKEAALGGNCLVDATTEFSQSNFNQPFVSITFDAKGSQEFAAITGSNVGKRLAIVLDGTVYSAPVIREKIPSGRAQISGSFSVREANDLAIVLRAGALPAPVEIIEERIVGPSLGRDSISKGIRSTLIGGMLVFIFMAGYYLLAGLVADFAVILNLILIMAAMACFHATLTIPGIAGLVLTIGMSVDANVLIFERIREESKLGKSLRAAIEHGFKRAFLTIFDANFTTLITALILFQFGSGPVRGFATTLSIGLIASMFTAIIVTRLILDMMTQGEDRIERLTMLQFVKDTKIDFVGIRKIAYALSLVVIAAGMIAFVQRKEKNFGIDFTGGVLQEYKFAKAVHVEDIRKALAEIGSGNIPIQQFENKEEILIRTIEDNSDQIKARFKEVFGENGFEVMRLEKVGPSVGKDMVDKAIKAVLWSFVGIGLYVAFRFDFKFAVGGILALFHDVLVCIGALALTHRELSIDVMAALLTIIGYSINDTIVIFDRIREVRKLMRKSSQNEIINLSINQTLSRTILTSLTVFLVVLSLYFFGGTVINDFAFVMLIGVVTGTYSSIFIAVPVVVDWPTKRANKAKK